MLQIATLGALFLPRACVQLWSAMLIPNSSFLIQRVYSPHTSAYTKLKHFSPTGQGGQYMDYLMLVDKFNPIDMGFYDRVELTEVNGKFMESQAGNRLRLLLKRRKLTA